MGFLFLFIVDPLIKFGSHPYAALALHLARHFAQSESFPLRLPSVLGCRTLSPGRPRLAALVPLAGKLRLVTSRSRDGLVVIPKALAVACWSVVATPFAILPPPHFGFCPLAPYCPLRWHLTALPPPWLAPCCYSPAGTLLRLIGWHPTARWAFSPLYPL